MLVEKEILGANLRLLRKMYLIRLLHSDFKVLKKKEEEEEEKKKGLRKNRRFFTRYLKKYRIIVYGDLLILCVNTNLILLNYLKIYFFKHS